MRPLGCYEETPKDSKLPCCMTVTLEPLFRAWVVMVFAIEGLVLNGSIIDSGANTGGESCFLADLRPGRIVHAIEPLEHNLRSVKKVAASRPTVVPMLGGLGNVERTLNIHTTAHVKSGLQLMYTHRAKENNSTSSGSFPIRRVDSLFANEWAGESLAFAHWDVEGAELDLLQGAMATIRRDRPVFSIEVGVGFTLQQALPLLRSLGYGALVVPEVCGTPRTCRNALCFPKERLPPPDLVNRSEHGVLYH